MSLPTSPEAYESLIDESFQLLSTSAVAIELKLVRVTRKLDDDVQQIFHLTFEGPNELLPQGLYHLRHARLDVPSILLVPSARIKTGFRYEATFNLLKQQF
jgi:hypothetical protein